MTGYIFAFISSLFFSAYIIPRKLTKIHPLQFSLIMSSAYFLGSIIVFLLNLFFGNSEKSSSVLLLSILAGIIWAFGFVLFVKAIDILGLARSNQWKNLQGPAGVILSLIVLNEIATTNPIFVLLAGLTVFLSALMLTIPKLNETREVRLKGILLAILPAVGFGVVTLISKYVTQRTGVFMQQMIFSGAVFFSLLFYISFNQELFKGLRKLAKRDLNISFIAGLLYLGASFFLFETYRYIPASIGFTIIQLNTVWTISISIIIFKEIEFKKNYLRILAGLLLAIAGILLLVLAKK